MVDIDAPPTDDPLFVEKVDWPVCCGARPVLVGPEDGSISM